MVGKVNTMEHDIRLSCAQYRLEPLQHSDIEALYGGMDPDMWGGMTTVFPADANALWEQLEPAIRAPDVMVFTALHGTRVVGSTRFYDIVPSQRRLEIGTTFYARSAWGTALNPACKLMLMEYAFESMLMHRVALRCDVRNTRSARAIERLGAKPEGILREHRIDGHGTISDTAYFSVLEVEWPQVKSSLQDRIN